MNTTSAVLHKWRGWSRGALATMVVLILGACGGKGQNNPELVGDDDGLDDADRFLEYFDPQADLAGGRYRVTVSRAGSGTTQAFTLEIDLSNGDFIERNGRWSPGQNSVDFSFDLAEFGGAVIRLDSGANGALTLKHVNSGGMVAQADKGGVGQRESLKLFESEVDSTRYARAYYEVVDPLDQRTTLEDWKQASGLNDCNVPIIEVKFRDTKDLGYGRHMRACTDTPGGGFAYFVDNYQVDPIPALGYSALNLEAVLNEDVEWNLGTNAIEFSPPQDADGNPVTMDANGNPVMIAKFFTFEPRGEGPVRERKLQADLDGRGNKAMPMICVQCHGGRLLPLNPDGSFPRLRTDDNLGVIGGVEAKLQALEVDTFEFPDSGPFSRARQEEKFRKINESVYESYGMGDYDEAGEWDSSFVTDLLDGWYGGDITVNGAEFDQSYVPPGWQPDPGDGNPPVGADELFREVISPRCIVCHGKRGTNLQDDISFSTWQDFIDHADQIEELIFDEALMPAARVEFDAMWEDGASDEEAALIGSFLPGFTHGNADGSVDRPGRAHADAGPDRTVSALPVTLSAEDSFFAKSYEWTLVSAPGGGAVIRDAGSARATLDSTAGNGDYVVRLMVTDARGNRDSDKARITVDANMEITVGGVSTSVPAPRELRFASSGVLTIRDVLQNTVTDGNNGDMSACTLCHSSGGAAGPGVPMWWTNGVDQDFGTATAGVDKPSLYQRAMTRVNLRDPAASLILRKPSGNHHNGLLQRGFDIDDSDGDGDLTEQYAYDVFYTWIVEGAPE